MTRTLVSAAFRANRFTGGLPVSDDGVSMLVSNFEMQLLTTSSQYLFKEDRLQLLFMNYLNDLLVLVQQGDL